jgi:predicted enzyme related to lactoylglutathione lyase
MDDVFKALADPTRRRILDELTERNGQTLFEICSRLATKHQLGSSRQAISQHLQLLEASGLIETKREGRFKFHYLNTRPLERIADRWLEPHSQEAQMRIHLSSIPVDDQDKALRFYTDVLGFAKKADFSNGPFRWLTVTSPDDPNGTELQLALNNNPAAKTYQQALFQQGQPAAMFFTDDIKGDYERITARGGTFTMPPTEVTASTIAQLDDTCGNLIQITQLARW